MKKLRVFSILMACLLALGLSLAACNNGTVEDPEPPPSVVFENSTTDGSIYRLTITQKAALAASASFTPAQGDAYLLEIIKDEKVVNTSTGTVQGVATNAFTLKPSNSGASTFTVQISGEQIAGITGPIAVHGSETPLAAPPVGSFTVPGGGSGGFGGGGGGYGGGGSYGGGGGGGGNHTHTHTWGEWEETSPATCETAGVETRTCTTNPSHKETRPGAPALGHDWGEWIVTKPATGAEDGIETSTCKNDSAHTKDRPIPKDPNLPGGENNPFEVYDVPTLQKVGSGLEGWVMAAHYRQTANIDLASIDNWTPIALPEYYMPHWIGGFTGTYEGNNFTISNLTINRPDEDYQGLFGSISPNSTVKNLKLTNVNITGKDNVGGLIGFNNEGAVLNCSVTGKVSGNNNIGGVVGYNYGCATVSGSSSASTVNGNACIGGVVGYNSYSDYDNGSKVENSYSTGNITGGTAIGGLIGVNSGSTVSYSYATGNVTGDARSVGGLVGISFSNIWAGMSPRSTITYCYATGNVTSTTNYYDNFAYGGLVGWLIKTTVSDCYATGNVTGSEKEIGGLVGEMNEEAILKNSYATGTVSGSYMLGGLSGAMYGTVDADGNNYVPSGVVSNSVALGSGVYGSAGRVTGRTMRDDELVNNYARDDMTIEYTGIPIKNANSANGADITAAEWGSSSWWTDTVKFNPGIWELSGLDGTRLPTLKNMPAGTQNPVVKNN